MAPAVKLGAGGKGWVTSSESGGRVVCSKKRRAYIHVGSTAASLPPKFSEQTTPASLFSKLRTQMTGLWGELLRGEFLSPLVFLLEQFLGDEQVAQNTG